MNATALDESRAYRRALGAYPTGVAVVTTETSAGVAAITVNSFVSVSLRPPLISWSIAETSDRYRIFSEAETWGLSVLCATQKEIAACYAAKGAGPTLDYEVHPLGDTPAVKHALARFACRTTHRLPAGDHLLIIGAVEEFETREGRALTYRLGAFGTHD
jgi:flavin reductase (DIM6/NTAB) family NADH-FMN oxidoreductase RutF